MFCFALLLACSWWWSGCRADIAGRRAADHSTSGGGAATHVENRPGTKVRAAGDAEVNNWSFTTVGSGWPAAGIAGAASLWLGWRGRKHRKALDDVIGAIEELGNKGAKMAIAERGNRWLNAQVKKKTEKPSEQGENV